MDLIVSYWWTAMSIRPRLYTPKILVGIVLQEAVAAGPVTRSAGNGQRHSVTERFGGVLFIGRNTQHLVFRNRNRTLRQAEAPCSLQHHHHALRLMPVALRHAAFADLYSGHLHCGF